MSGQVNVKNLTGGEGGEVVTGPRQVTGRFHAVQALDNVLLGPCVCNLDQSTSSLNNLAIAPGVVIYGVYTSVTIAQGSAIVYNKE